MCTLPSKPVLTVKMPTANGCALCRLLDVRNHPQDRQVPHRLRRRQVQHNNRYLRSFRRLRTHPLAIRICRLWEARIRVCCHVSRHVQRLIVHVLISLGSNAQWCGSMPQRVMASGSSTVVQMGCRATDQQAHTRICGEISGAMEVSSLDISRFG